MPFNIQEGQKVFAQPQAFEPDRPATLGEQFTGATNLDNVSLAAYRLAGDALTTYEDEEDFNPLELLTEENAAYAPMYARAKSRREFDDIDERIKRETNAMADLQNGPWNPFLVSIIAAAADPVTFIPFFGQLGKGAQGLSVAARVGRGAAITAGEIAVGEAVLQAQQETRTAATSLAAIVIGAGFGGALTGAGIALNRSRDADFSRTVDDAVEELAAVSEAMRSTTSTDLSAGAALASREAIIPGPLTEPVARKGVEAVKRGITQLGTPYPIFTSPALELSVSNFPTVRSFITKMTDTGVLTKGQVEGLSLTPGGGWSQRISRWRGLAVQGSNMIEGAWKQAKTDGFTGDYNQFKVALNDALNTGDKSPIPSVEALAQTMRDKILNPVGEQLKKEGLIEDLLFGGSDPAKGQSWYTRSWSKRKLIENAAGFKQEMTAYFRKAIEAHNEAIARAAEDVESGATNPRDIDRALGSSADKKVLDPDEDAADFAEQIWRQITGTIQERNVPIKITLRGSTKPRGLHVPHEVAKKWINDDAEMLLHGYLRSVGADLEAVRVFGSLNIEDTMAWKRLEKEVSDAVANATGKEAADIQKRGTREMEVLQELWGRIRGVDIDSQKIEAFRDTQTVLKVGALTTKLGAVVASSLSDVARVAMVEGFYRANKGLLLGALDGFRGIRMTVKEAQLFGGGLQRIDNRRALSAYDIGDPWATRSKTDIMSNKFASVFMKTTGLPHWTDGMQGWHAFIATNRIFDIAEKVANNGGKLDGLSRFDKRKLAQDNLTPMVQKTVRGPDGTPREVFEPDTSVLLAIAGEKENWTKVSGGWAPNVDKWKNPRAAEAYRAAIFREMETGVYNVAPADRPLWSSSPSIGGLGKTISQFKAFGMAAATRMSTAVVQESANGELATVMGRLAYMIAMGMAAVAVHDILRDGKVDENRSPEGWVANGIDRSGVLSIYTELEGLLQSMNLPSPLRYASQGELSRFRSRGPIAQMAGPALGLGEQVSRSVYGLTRGEFTESDMHGIRGLIPWQNHFAVGQGFNYLEKAIADDFDLRPRER